MKECPKCHKQYDDKMSFCIADGEKLVEVQAPAPKEAPAAAQPMKECPKCHKKYDMKMSFCIADGEKLVEVQAPAPAPKEAPAAAQPMKECPKCHKKYDMKMSFCIADGEKLVEVQAPAPKEALAAAQPMKECPKCHKKYDMKMSFCIADGEKLVVVASPKPEPPSSRSPSRDLLSADGTLIALAAAPPKPAASAAPPSSRSPSRDLLPHRGLRAATSSQQPAPAPKPPKPKKPVDPKKKRRNKRLIIIFSILLLLAGAAVGAYFFVYNATTYINAAPGQVAVGKGGGTAKVAIDYDGYLWSVAEMPEWVEADKDGNEMTITVSPNTSGTSRVGSITLTSGKVSTQVNISQTGNVTHITPSVHSLTFHRDGGTQTFTIQTDGAIPTFECPDFLAAECRNDTVIVKATANNGNYRNGILVLKEDNIRTSLMVDQAGACPTCQGTGKVKCTSCNGTGRFTYGRSRINCVGCNGTGNANCDDCGGTGEIGQ